MPMISSNSRNVLGALRTKVLAPNNRGIVLDLAVFVVNLLIVRAASVLANSLVHTAVEDVRAKLAIGFFFAGLILLQPLGPILKRWSFHQRHTFDTESGAGCILFLFMFVYFVLMFALCTVAAVVLGGVFSAGGGGGGAFPLVGVVWGILD